jgi:ubiquinone/menaquinone biosynthesis C-methylase UbiE
MKRSSYIKNYYNKYYTNNLYDFWSKSKILNAFKTYENDSKQGSWLSRRMRINGNEKILDCGCGIGGLMKEISELYPDTEIHGINISNKQIEMAKNILESYKNCHLSIQDFTNTNYKDNSFDIIYFCESICYSDYSKALKESYRLLKPAGTLYIKDLIIKCPKDKLSKNELKKLKNFSNSWYTEVYDTDTIIDKIDKIGGFDLIDTRRFIKPSINWINAVRNSSLKKYHKAKLSNIPPVRGADFLYIKRGKNES